MPGKTLPALLDRDAAPVPAAPGSRSSIDAIEAYISRATPFDELCDDRREIRPAWREFAHSFDALGRDELARRWEQARHAIHDNGVSFNVYGDAGGMERPWPLGPMPILVDPREFA